MLTISKITSFLKQNKKIFYYLLFFGFLLSISGDFAFAADENNDGIDDSVSTTLDILDGIMKGVAGILALMTYLVTMFLDPAWLNGSVFGMTEHFKKIWILVSNIVYFIFAFILIWIAFMNIIGKGDKWELKQALPKFIVGVLIIPFSWFLIQFILSISAIFTASVLTLPSNTFSEYDTKLSEVTIPSECKINFGSKDNSPTQGTEGPPKPDPVINCEIEGSVPISFQEALSSKNIQGAIFGSLATYTYGIINFQSLSKVNYKDLSYIKTIGDLIFKVLFDVLFVIIFAILMITLGLVLIIRGIYIWIYTMMSPVFGLMYFFDKKDGGGEGFFGKFSLKEFIALAMVPVYVMAALSFGFLFIHVVSTGMFESSTEGVISVQDGTEGKDSVIGIGDFKLHISGSLASANNDSLATFVKKEGSGTLGLIGGLILQLFGIVVLRGAVMAALRSSAITKTITEPIYQFGNQVGGLVAKSPMYAPVFGGQSMKSMQTIAGSVQSSVDQKSINRASQFTSKHMPFLDSSAVSRNADLRSAANRIDTGVSGSNAAIRDELSKALSLYRQNPNLIIGDKGFEDFMKTIGNKLVGNKLLTQEEVDRFDFSNLTTIAKTVVAPIEAKFDTDTSIQGLTAGVDTTSEVSEEWLRQVILGASPSSQNPSNPPNNPSSNQGVSLGSDDGVFNIHYGDVNARIRPVNDPNGNITGLESEDDYRHLANAISQGYIGNDLIKGLGNMGAYDTTEIEAILEGVKQFLDKDDSDKIVFNSDGGSNSVTIDNTGNVN